LKMARKEIKVGTVAITCGSNWPLLNDGLLVVVTAVGHRMDPSRYTIKRVDGQLLPLVGGEFYKAMTAKISGARLIPVDEDGTDNGVTARPASQPRTDKAPAGVAA
jgi:hypothetical protein